MARVQVALETPPRLVAVPMRLAVVTPALMVLPVMPGVLASVARVTVIPRMAVVAIVACVPRMAVVARIVVARMPIPLIVGMPRIAIAPIFVALAFLPIRIRATVSIVPVAPSRSNRGQCQQQSRRFR